MHLRSVKGQKNETAGNTPRTREENQRAARAAYSTRTLRVYPEPSSSSQEVRSRGAYRKKRQRCGRTDGGGWVRASGSKKRDAVKKSRTREKTSLWPWLTMGRGSRARGIKCSLSLSLSLPLPHTHTQTWKHTRVRGRVRERERRCPLSLATTGGWRARMHNTMTPLSTILKQCWNCFRG